MTDSEDRRPRDIHEGPQHRDVHEDRDDSDEPSGWGPGYPPVDIDKAIDAAREVWDTLAAQLTGQKARRAWKSGPPRPARPGQAAQTNRTEQDRPGAGKHGPSYTVPVSPGSNVTVSGPFPLDESEWEQLLTVLTAMKPALVKPGHRHDETSTDASATRPE